MNRVIVDNITLILNGFGYPNDTRIGEPIYPVIPPKKIQKHNILNKLTDSVSSFFDKTEIM